MKVRLTLNVLTASMLLAACAQTQPRQELNIQPLQEVRHSYEQAKAQYALGRYYHGQLRYERAIEAYRRALAMDPGMVDAMNAMGAAYAESGNLALAREQFEAALKLQPESVYTYNNLGFVNYLSGDYPAAVAAYKQALRLDGSHEKARQNLILAMDRMGEGDHIARTSTQEPVAVVAQTTGEVVPQQETRSAWVQVSPVIFEMHSAVVPAQQPSRSGAVAGIAPPVASIATRAADPVAVREATVISSAPVAPAALEAAASKSSAPIAVKVAQLGTAVSAQKVVAHVDVKGVEVSNGNGVRGMAAMVARYFSGQGVQQARLTNQKPFSERRTRIEYRPGSAAQAARINGLLPKAAPQVASNNLRPGIQVRLVLGHDLARDVAAWDKAPAKGLVTAGLDGIELPQL